MSSPKKILYLENAIGWGGAAICLKLMAQHLDRAKYLPVVTTPHRDANYQSYGEVSSWHYIPDRVFDKAALLQRYPVPAKLASLLNYALNVLPYTVRLLALAKRERVDLIHLNNEPINNMAGILVARLCGIPCVSHVRGWIMWNSPMSRRLYGLVDQVITVADWIKTSVLALGMPQERVQTINDGRILSQFLAPFDRQQTRGELGIQQGELAVGIVGLLIPWKGHQVFLDAAEMLRESHPECVMLVIGDAPNSCSAYGKELVEQVRQRKLANVRFTGRRSDIPDVMRSLDVVVHASVEPDPYPNVVIEGMAAGSPVIASRLGGPPEMIEHEKTGLLVQHGDPRVLAEVIGRLLDSAELRATLGGAAKKRAFEVWSIEEHMRQIEQVYDRLLG